jgi:signal transduction histidine kinase
MSRRTRRRPPGPRHLRLPLIGEVAWPTFFTATLVLPPSFVVLVWLFFSRVDWPVRTSTRALFVTAVSVVLALGFAVILLRAIGRAYVHLEAALRKVRRQNLQLRALHQAGLALNEDLDVPAVLARIAALSRHVLDVATAEVALADEGEGDGEADASVAADGLGATRLRVPVRFHGQLLAMLYLDRPGIPFGPEERQTAERFATRAGAALANAHLLETIRELGGAAERERIARELHDGTIQALYGLSLEMQATLLTDGPTEAELEAALRASVGRLGAIIQDLRAYVSESTHRERDHVDLGAALRQAIEPVVRGAAPALSWRVEPDARIPMPAGAAHELTQVVREAVANAVRHAEARSIDVALRLMGATLAVEVRDDGRGFDPGRSESAGGLATMGARMRALGGELSIESGPGAGTRVIARLPWGVGSTVRREGAASC